MMEWSDWSEWTDEGEYRVRVRVVRPVERSKMSGLHIASIVVLAIGWLVFLPIVAGQVRLLAKEVRKDFRR